MSKFEIRHTFEMKEGDFWSKTFFDPEFNRRLYKERLGFPQWEVLEEDEQSDGTYTRRVQIEPKAEAPAAIQKLIGSGITYVENGTWDPKSKRFRFRIEPSKLRDKVATHGEMWTEAKGDHKCERVVSVEVNASIFGVGKMLENFIEKSVKENYEAAAEFTVEWIREKGL